MRASRFIRLYCAASLTLWSCVSGAAAQDEADGTPTPASTNSRLEEINQKVEAQSQSLKEAIARQAQTEKALNDVRKSLKVLEQQEQEAGAQLEKSKTDRAGAEKDLAVTEAKFEKVATLSLKRFRALYMQKSDQGAQALLLVSDSSTLERNAYFLTKIRAADKSFLGELDALAKQKVELKSAFDKAVAKQEDLHQKAEARRVAMKDRSVKQEALAKDLKQQRSELEQGLAGLKAQALRLETVVVSLTGAPEERANKRKNAQPEPSVGGAGYEGGGLQKLKGSLSWPVQGKIVQRFGRSRNGGFKDLVFSKGVEIAAEPDSRVGAISDGRVAFVGKMPGYGTVVIVDHGSRFYSLYGRLAEAKVRNGNIVATDELVGYTAQDEERAGNFYFELRKDGAPVDPVPYLKPEE